MTHVRHVLFAIVLLSFAVLYSPTTTPALAADHTSVKGIATDNLYTDGCTSPIGLCGKGQFSGSINGTIVGILNTQRNINLKGKLFAYNYTGQATITTPQGNLYGSLNTTIQVSNDAVVTAVSIHRGTGNYQDTHGLLILTGTPPGNDGQETYNYTGWLSIRGGNDN